MENYFSVALVNSPSMMLWHYLRSYPSNLNSPSFSPIKKPCYEIGEGSSSKVSVSRSVLREGPFPFLDMTRHPNQLINSNPSFHMLIEEPDSENSSNDSNSPTSLPLAIDKYASNLKGDEEQFLDNGNLESRSAEAMNQPTKKQVKDSMVNVTGRFEHMETSDLNKDVGEVLAATEAWKWGLQLQASTISIEAHNTNLIRLILGLHSSMDWRAKAI
ncbi:hypothetical protein C5167_026871 [Papaver somniferum]|uniref:uncharacterized protein LOC113341358 n=1 Tax=Papaver somniferum TaxID=3469 RepID=UPI000E6FD015|nr:uncharacterized protein LOC113341358 [Papaver somniferum]RZC92238.1 hypothetical protein C5167_026871 [Papaver somniferum]